jgi:hypothetical protein
MCENKPTGPNAEAAHVFLTEILTRISTQRLYFSEGDEKTALTSLHALFDVARETINDNFGCEEFSKDTVAFLNGEFRSFMAKWHRKSLDGELDTRDGAVEFRMELRTLQDNFQVFAGTLHKMAYGTPLADVPINENRNFAPTDPLDYGIPKDGLIQNNDVEHINSAEVQAIAKRRSLFAEDLDTSETIKNAAGLALSGGGIRAASFSLGVSQVFAQHSKIMNSFDLLSTVSGGGFTGSFLVRRIEAGGVEAVANPKGPDTDAIKYLRQRADYLVIGSFWLTLATAVNMLAGMILNWTAPAAIIAVLVVLALIFDLGTLTSGFASPVVAFFCFVGALILYAWVPYSAGRLRIILLWISFLVGGLVLATFLIGYGYAAFIAMLDAKGTGLTLSVVTIAAVLPALSRILPVVGQAWFRMIGNQVVVIVASIAVPFLALVFAYSLYRLGTIEILTQTSGIGLYFPTSGMSLLALITVLLVGTALVTIDINATGPHWVYRQQLANTFVRSDPKGTTEVPLSEIDPDQKAPYLLMNAVVNLPNSEKVEMRERRGDFFLFSKNWCGSPVTGYRPTKTWLRWHKKEIDLATAIATSGAAVAPHMALLSMSSARSLLSFLNVRLGFWIQRPALNATEPKGSGGRPGARMLLREMLGMHMDEKQDWMMLTDGAHLDNSAIYELLRRRCKYIVAVDASAETDASFETIITLARHAAVDFGVRINTDLKELRPAPETGLSRAHGVLCEIKYPKVGSQPAGTGLLLIIKLSMTGNESELIKAYRHAHPEFPNQSTVDQFFDEHQFEAFRALGSHAAESLFEEALIGPGEVTSVANWLDRLYLSIPPKRDT